MKTGIQGLDLLFGKRRQQAPVLGERELEIMKVLWQGSPRSAQQVLDAGLAERISLSTVQSTLERLHRKGLLERHKCGRSYLYTPTLSRSAFISQLLGSIAEQISDGEMAPMISGFMSFYEQESGSDADAGWQQLKRELPVDHDD